MKTIPLLLAACFVSALAQDKYENTGVRIALKIFEDCVAADAVSSCLKKKAITFMDRLERTEKFSLTDGITIIRSTDAQNDGATSENQLENTQRSSSVKDDSLLDKISKYIGSRTLEITMPKFSLQDIEEG